MDKSPGPRRNQLAGSTLHLTGTESMSLHARLLNLYYRFRNSIGFYPALIALGYFLFVAIVLVLGFSPASRVLQASIPWAGNYDPPTSKAVLTTLVTGIISLTVLSFSMVMVVLSNTSSTFSPKLILGLISERPHQIVLGNYIGTTVYCLILLFATAGRDIGFIPALAVWIAAAMGLWCLVLFVYFIHHISVSIQINNIMQRIYIATRKELEKRQASVNDAAQHWQSRDETIMPRFEFVARQSGYFQDVDLKDLISVAARHDMIIRMHLRRGEFVVAGAPFITCSKSPDELDPKTIDQIHGSFIFFRGERIEVNYVNGFTQLMEIAVKALSPGINDPGTACICIDYLTDLFVLRAKLRDHTVYYDDDSKPRLIIPTLPFGVLLSLCIGPIRLYGNGDLAVSSRLLKCLKTIAELDKEAGRHRRELREQAIGVLENIQNSSFQEIDRETIHFLAGDSVKEDEGFSGLPQT